MQFIQSLLRKKILVAAVIVILGSGGYYIYRQSTAKNMAVSYVTGQVTRGTLITSVSGTGQAETSDQMDLKPQTDGRLTSVKVKENQQVKINDVIATIDPQSAANDVAKARASLDQAQASYDKLVAGATSNAIATQRLSVKSSEQALDRAKTDYEDTIAEQQQNVDKSLTTLLNSGIEASPINNISTITLTISGSYSGVIEGKYIITTFMAGDGTHYQASGLGSGNALVTPGLKQSIGSGLYLTFSSTGTISPSTSWTIDVPNKASSNYVSNLDAYNTALRNQKQAIESAHASIDSAESSLERANLQMEALLEAPTNADFASAKAQITSAQAQLANAQTAYSNTILRSPFDGVIASVKFSAGDKVTAGSIVATIITNQQVAKISLNEVEVAKVKLGQKATMTFDALDSLSITGKVVQIDTIGTVSQGVVTYNIIVAFDVQNDQVRPGMSTTVDIVIDVKQDVLIVPSAAVKTQGSQHYVQTLENGAPKNQTVEIGSSNGTDTEISSGLTEGQEVVTQTINPSSTTTSKTTTGSSNLRIPGLGGGR